MSTAADAAHYLRPGLLQLPALPPLSVYVHLPWCLRKCPYCDFNSHEAQGRRGAGAALRRCGDGRPGSGAAAGLGAHRAQRVHRRRHAQPVLAGSDRVADWRACAPGCKLEPGCEITLEANPGTFEKDRFRAFRDAGVTRLSIGVQSFNDQHLRALGRVHDRRQAIAAAEEAALAFDTFNLDLMYALPGQDLAMLEQDLTQALALMPPHLSVYHLTIEPNTFFARHPPPLPEDDLAYAMLDRITEMTTAAGLERYEVSAYAKPDHACRHNLNYWQFGDYLGLGAGAHGKLSFPHRIVRQVRFRDPRLYMDKALAGNAVTQEEEVPRRQLPFEFMLNALRLRRGFALRSFCERTGLPLSAIEPQLAQAKAQGSA